MIGVILIAFFGMLNISKNTSLRIVGDEFGYWTAAATIDGFDWSSVASYNQYYGIGYGLLLAPILKLNLPQTIIYQIAILLNVLMLIAAFYLFFRTVENSCSSSLLAGIISITGVLYSANLCYSQFTLSETFILLLYLLIVLFLNLLLSHTKYWYILATSVLLGLIVATHMRGLGIVAVTVFFYVVFAFTKKKYKEMIVFVTVTVIAVILVLHCKNRYQEIIHSINPANELSGVLPKIKQVFTAKGFLLFLEGFMGKSAYSFLATGSLISVAAIRIITNLFSESRKKHVRPITAFGCYLLFCLIAMEAVSSIFLIDYRTRMDLLTYGRYHDFTLCALIVFELYSSFANKEKLGIRCFLIAGLLTVLASVTVMILFPYGTAKTHFSIYSPGIALSVLKGNYIIVLLVFNLAVLTLYYYTQTKENTTSKLQTPLLFCIILNVFFVVMATGSLRTIYSWSVEGCSNEERLAKKVLEDKSAERLWYYTPDSPIDIDFMQFLLRDKPIICFDDVSILSEFDESDYLFTTGRSKLIDKQWLREYKQIGSSSYLKLWVKNTEYIAPEEIKGFTLNDIRNSFDSFSTVVQGIHRPEENGTIWANGKLTCELANPFRFYIKGYVPNYPENTEDGLTIEAFANDVTIGVIYAKCGEQFEFEIGSDVFTEVTTHNDLHSVTLTLVPSYVFCPNDYGGRDSRVLSYIVQDLSYTSSG